MYVKITNGDAWYKDMVGKIIEVEETTCWFRETGGGKRVPHYLTPQASDSFFNQKVIDCRDAEVVIPN